MTHPIAAQRDGRAWARAWRVLRWPLGGLAALLLLILAVALAWVLSNLGDAKPQPLPSELALAPPALADERNAAWALIGLDLASAGDLAQAGRERWRAELAFASKPLPVNEEQARAHLQAGPGSTVERIKSRFEGPPLNCAGDAGDCTAVWLANPAAVAAQRAPLAEFGQRCEALVDGGLAFDEPLPPPAAIARVGSTHALNAVACQRWFHSGAALALSKGQRDGALIQLERADKLWRALLGGSRTLMSQVVALRLARNSLDALASLAAHDAALAHALSPLLVPPPDALALIRRWVPVEASIMAAMLDDIVQGCQSEASWGLVQTETWLQAGVDGVDRWLCRHRIGLHPERTKQRAHTNWVAFLGGLEQGVEPRLHERIEQATVDAERVDAWWTRLRWRNTFGSMLGDTGAQTTVGYLPRYADLTLRHELARLVVSAQLQGVPAAERAAWSARQDLSAGLRERLSWADGGRTMLVRSWAEDMAQRGQDTRRDAIRVHWPA